MNCTYCQLVAPGTWEEMCDEMIDAGWIPYYYIGRQEMPGPVCPDCCGQHLRLSEDGEWEARVPKTIAHKYN